jgi:hypothetical protein
VVSLAACATRFHYPEQINGQTGVAHTHLPFDQGQADKQVSLPERG